MARILVVDDEKSLVKGICYSLEQESHETSGAYDGITALEEIRSGRYDLVVLDLMLPGLDGFSICRKVREENSIPIIMLTARGDDIDKITGLELGADDYLPKPFNIRELIARINSVLRRTHIKRRNTIKYHDLTLNLDSRRLTIKDQDIDLTSKEFDLLAVFMQDPGRVYSRGQLIDAVWSMEYADERTVDVNIRRIREKIEEDSRQPKYLLTKWGIGYYFRELV